MYYNHDDDDLILFILLPICPYVILTFKSIAMLRKYFFYVLLLVFVSCSNDAPEVTLRSSTLISSPSFEQALIDIGIDSDGILNGTILTDDISKITYLPLFDRNISDLSGLENFSGLKKLDCYKIINLLVWK